MKAKQGEADTQHSTRQHRRVTSAARNAARAEQSRPRSATRVIRFRLSPYRRSDQRILDWLVSFPPYYRASAIRTVLLEYVLRLAAAHEGADTRHEEGGNSHLPPQQTLTLPARQSGPLTAAEKKLKSLFS
jgi:hypothetical protein